MGNKKITARFVKLSSEYAAPTVKIQDGDEMIHYGDNNLFPQYLLSLFRNSGLNRAIIERKVKMLIGNGVNYEEPTEDVLMGNRFESVNEIVEKCAYDLETFGGYYLQIVRTRDGNIAEYYHMPYELIRAGVPNEFNQIDTYYYWNKKEPLNAWNDVNEFVKFPAFNINDRTSNQILAVKKYSPSNKYYGGANYEGALLDIQTYMEISNFHNSNLHNNFAPGYIVFFRGPEPDDESQDEIVDTIKEKYDGTDNVGKPMIFFLDSEQEAPQIEALDVSDLDKQFEQLLTSIKDNIVISHGIPRQVIGMESQGSLGNSKEILQASQMFRSDYIEPEQKTLLRGFNMIQAINNDDDYIINNPNPNIISLDIAELLQFLDKNEVRELYGYEELDDAQITDTNTDTNE